MESGHCQDIACIDYTRPLKIEEVDDSVQVQSNDKPQFAPATMWSKVSEDTDMSEMKQARVHTENTDTPAVETEVKKHEVQDMPVMDDAGIFQVTKRNILARTCSRNCVYLKYMGAGLFMAVSRFGIVLLQVFLYSCLRTQLYTLSS
jgi:hypothetical protein